MTLHGSVSLGPESGFPYITVLALHSYFLYRILKKGQENVNIETLLVAFVLS